MCCLVFQIFGKVLFRLNSLLSLNALYTYYYRPVIVQSEVCGLGTRTALYC